MKNIKKEHIKISQHIKISHKFLKEFLKTEDNVIDATLGNGHDTFFLSKIIKKGKIFSLDIQKKAIENSFFLLKSKNISLNNIFILNRSHKEFSFIPKNIKIKLIIYNLGYLPGSSKKIVTKTASTLKSIKNALEIIEKKGAISIMCYTGHPEGEKEEKAIISFLSNLPLKQYTISLKKWLNKKNSPSFIVILKN